MAGRFHREPGEPVGIVVAVRELVEGAFEPVARVGKPCVKFRCHFGAYFVARLADAGAERRDHVFRLRVELHLHPPQRFCRRCGELCRANQNESQRSRGASDLRAGWGRSRRFELQAGRRARA